MCIAARWHSGCRAAAHGAYARRRAGRSPIGSGYCNSGEDGDQRGGAGWKKWKWIRRSRLFTRESFDVGGNKPRVLFYIRTPACSSTSVHLLHSSGMPIGGRARHILRGNIQLPPPRPESAPSIRRLCSHDSLCLFKTHELDSRLDQTGCQASSTGAVDATHRAVNLIGRMLRRRVAC